MICEIVNPSDPYTIEHDDPIVIAAAVCLLGEGHYAARDKEGTQVCPLFVFGGFEKWWASKGVGEFGAWIEANRPPLTKAFASVTIGSIRDAEEVKSALAGMSETDGLEWLAKRHDARRSSLNDIGGRARQFAERLAS